MRQSAVLGLLAAALHAGPAAAQSTFPERDVRIIVPWQSGVPYNTAQLVVQHLKQLTGQGAFIDLKTGAGGAVGFRAGAAAPADGHHLLLGSAGLTTNWALLGDKTIDPARDIVPLSALIATPYVIVARPDKYTSLAQLIQAAKAAPGKLNYASPGVGSGPHLTTELLISIAGVKLENISYRGGSEQLVGLLAGDVDIAVTSLVASLPHIQSGRVKALAVTSLARAPIVPDVPTLNESGYPGFPGVNTWFGLFAPPGLPAAQQQQWTALIARFSRTPEFAKTVNQWGAVPDLVSPAELGQRIVDEKVRWARLIKENHIAVQ